MNHSELKKQQEIQLKMLADFDAFCKSHGLTYFMVYGTLLGAVRHKGFIPWDYDIDTAMIRAEYEKFKAIQHKLPPHLSIWEVCYSDIDHAGLARLMYHDNELGNVQIDIFILDYRRESWFNGRITDSICRLLHFAKLSKNEKSILLKRFSNQPLKQAVVHLSKAIRILVGGSAAAERLIYKLRVSKGSTKYLISLEGQIPLPTKYFNNPILLPFDGHSFYAPQNANELLTLMYGNYLEIPPEGHLWLKEEGLE